ncbi:MAG: tetratricopeptide repeat protein [Opitutales bacterium]
MKKILSIAIALTFMTDTPSLFAQKSDEEPQSSESMATYMLKRLGEREAAAFKRYEKAMATEDVRSIEAELQSIVDGYEKLISVAQGYSPVYISFGMFLHRTGERKASNAMLMRADEIDPYHAIVKNQLGNYLAEEGKYDQALAFYQMAIDLNPNEPLYHYQTGNLLFSYKSFFIDDKLFLPDGFDLQMQESFRTAAMLNPSHLPYRLRYAQSFFDVSRPNWDAAIEEWQQLVEFPSDPAQKQLMELYMARARFGAGHHTAARKIIRGINRPELQKSKEKLLALIDAKHPR